CLRSMNPVRSILHRIAEIIAINGRFLLCKGEELWMISNNDLSIFDRRCKRPFSLVQKITFSDNTKYIEVL
ncbi:hypothetical protein, partial [Vibrio tasmaniensis]|uniref:hypothetical protein n=1 Tax=Vibrio tasmaniensis TaxID=212663 RepID=UPI001A7E1BDE